MSSSMSTDDALDKGIQKATHAIHRSEKNQPRKGEKRLNAAGDAYETLSETTGQYMAATADLTSAGMDLLQSEMDNFKMGCDILMKTLDAVAEVHPFVTVAVLAFKTAITFELTRRQNDKRILALHIDMKDLMLRNLAQGDRGNDGTAIEDRLKGRMTAIAQDIETCASTCDGFQKKRLIVKVFKSIAWEGKLEEFATAFNEHKNALHRDLSMHASLAIDTANKTLAGISTTLDAENSATNMALVLQLLRSPDERELRKYIDSKGGPEKFLQDDTLMAELIVRSEKDDLSAGASTPQYTSDVRLDLQKDLGELLAENQEIFSNKFNALQDDIRTQMESYVSRTGDRIIGTILSGPHDRLIDPVVYQIWKDMGWKGSAKASHLVMAIRDYYTEHYTDALVIRVEARTDALRPTISLLGRETISSEISALLSSDRWALEYINIPRMQPLLEAIDDDASSFVTVMEINNFTQARPGYWSLTHWMAYWTVGFPLAMQHYYERIRKVLLQIADLSDAILPSNRAFYDVFAGSYAMRRTDSVLAGALSSRASTPWDEELFKRFDRYIDEQEKRVEKILKQIKYIIDSPTTLTLLLGSGRLEKHLLPLTYLMYTRCLRIFEAACQVPIHRKEVQSMLDSLDMVQQINSERIDTIKAMCKLQDLDQRKRFERFSFGLYYYMVYSEEITESEYYKTGYFNAENSMVSPTVLARDQTDTALDTLLHGPQRDEVDLSTYDLMSTPVPVENPAPSKSFLWHNCWRGFYESSTYRFNLGELDIEIPSGDAHFAGSGSDSMGDFLISGKRLGQNVLLDKVYNSADAANTYPWRFIGHLSDDGDAIAGTYGIGESTVRRDNEDRSPFVLRESFGNFKLLRRPIVYWIMGPADATFDSKALWHRTCNAVLYTVRSEAQKLPWSFFKARRDRRRRYLELYAKLDELMYPWGSQTVQGTLTEEEREELGLIETKCTKADLCFYRSFANSILRRHVVHLETYCDSCHKEPFLMTRLVCLQCSDLLNEGSVDTLDLCSSCVSAEFTRQSDGKVHDQSHPLLQIRKSVPQRRVYNVVSFAMDALNSSKLPEADSHGDFPEVQCSKCKKRTPRPFWMCIDCPAPTFVCMECNQKDEQDHISLLTSSEGSRLQSNILRPRSNSLIFAARHHWSHSLVLCHPAPENETAVPSVEERLTVLEQKFSELQAAVATRDQELFERLSRLECMLSILVSQGVQPNP